MRKLSVWILVLLLFAGFYLIGKNAEPFAEWIGQVSKRTPYTSDLFFFAIGCALLVMLGMAAWRWTLEHYAVKWYDARELPVEQYRDSKVLKPWYVRRVDRWWARRGI